MTTIHIQIKDEEGFITEFDGLVEAFDLKRLRKKAVKFIDSILGFNEALRLKIGIKNAGHNLEYGFRIPAIKAIRSVTGLGLKEAKDIFDTLDQDGTRTILLPRLFTSDESINATNTLNAHFNVEVC
jgi:hypothetical protein